METNTKELKATEVRERLARLLRREESMKLIKFLSDDVEKLLCNEMPNLQQIISMQMLLIEKYNQIMQGDDDLIYEGLLKESHLNRQYTELSKQFRLLDDKCAKAMTEAEMLKGAEKHFYWAYVRVLKLENLLIDEHLDVSELNQILNINNIPLEDENLDDNDDFNLQ